MTIHNITTKSCFNSQVKLSTSSIHNPVSCDNNLPFLSGVTNILAALEEMNLCKSLVPVFPSVEALDDKSTHESMKDEPNVQRRVRFLGTDQITAFENTPELIDSRRASLSQGSVMLNAGLVECVKDIRSELGKTDQPIQDFFDDKGNINTDYWAQYYFNLK